MPERKLLDYVSEVARLRHLRNLWTSPRPRLLKACGAGESIKPGVERSETPGWRTVRKPSARSVR